MVNDTLLGDPPKDSFFGVCKKKKKGGGQVEGLGGVAGAEITLFLSDHFKNVLISIWCDDSCF